MRRLLGFTVVALALATAACGAGDEGDEEGEASLVPPATAVSPTSAPPTTLPITDAFPPQLGDCPAEGSPASAARDLQFSVSTGDELVAGGIVWNVSVTNLGEDAVTLVYPNGQDGDVALRRGGEEAYRWSASQAFSEAVRCQSLAPGERYRFELGGTSLVVEPGAYRLVATLAADPAPEPFRRSVTLVPGEAGG